MDEAVQCSCRFIRIVPDDRDTPDVSVRCPRCGDVINALSGVQKTVRFEMQISAQLLAAVDAARGGSSRAAYVRAALQEKVKKNGK